MVKSHLDEDAFTLESGIQSLQDTISDGKQVSGPRFSEILEDGCDVLRDVTVDTPRLTVGITLLVGSVFGAWLARR